MTGCLITFEGGEGAGKTTQIQRLAAYLRDLGEAVTVTREPGGSPGAEVIRSVLLAPDHADFDAVTQALLFAAARRDHLRATIRPALAAGRIVLCDRFYDSTRAYQGANGTVPKSVVKRLESLAVGRLRPALTVILDLPPEIGMARAATRHGRPLASSDAFERQSLAFHQGVRAAFLAIAAGEPERCAVIDAARDADTVFADLRALIHARLPQIGTVRGES